MKLFKIPSAKDSVLPSDAPIWNSGMMIYALLKR
jgi:hypothetical protein